MHRPLRLLAPLLLLSAQAFAQPTTRPRPTALGKAVVTVADEFTHVGTVVELPGGRALITDEKDYRLAMADLTRGTTTNLGRTGSGPGEFRWIGGLLTAPHDVAYLLDPALHRLLPITSTGAFQAPVTIPAGLMVREVDSAGRLYGEMFHKRTPRGMADSMYVVRWQPGSARLDTVYSYDAGVSKSVGRGLVEAFPAIDTWTLTSTGDLLLLAARPYVATIVRGAAPVSSIPIPFQPIRLTARDRAVFTKARESQRVVTLGQPGAASAGRASPPPPEFPDVLPPFGGEGLGGRYTLRSPSGHVWISRLTAPSDSLARYDVLDGRTGRLLADIVLPARSRVAGLSRSHVFVATTDDDGIERVTAHSYPALTATR